jgi:eukaryotic-like serine/threonine-protein kinase
LTFFKEREARASEERLRKDAEVREKASHILLLVTQRRFEEADQLAANVPLNKPSIEIAAELRALGDWHALNGRWPEAAARFQSLLKVNQIEDVDLIAADHLRWRRPCSSLETGTATSNSARRRLPGWG